MLEKIQASKETMRANVQSLMANGQTESAVKSYIGWGGWPMKVSRKAALMACNKLLANFRKNERQTCAA